MADLLERAGRFNVSVGHFQAMQLDAKDDGGTTSSPYLQCNWDNFQRWETETIDKKLECVWLKEHSFEYSTRFLNKLCRKHLTIDCISKKKKRKIGSVRVNLHDLAAGPVHQKLQLTTEDTSDTSSHAGSRRVSGLLEFDVVMTQIVDLRISVRSLRLPPRLSTEPKDTIILYRYTASEKATGRSGAGMLDSSAGGAEMSLTWSTLPAIECVTTVDEVYASGLSLSVLNKKQKTELATAVVRFEVWHRFEDDEETDEFFVPLQNKQGTHLGQLSGRLAFRNFPQFAQMVGGCHTGHGVPGAKQTIDGVQGLTARLRAPPPKPPPPPNANHAHARAGSSASTAPAAVGDRAARAPSLEANPLQAAGVPSAAAPASGGGWAPASEGARAASLSLEANPLSVSTSVSAAVNDAYELDAAASSSLTTSGKVESGWVRCSPGISGARDFWLHEDTGRTALELPTQAEFSLMFREEGGLGIELQRRGSNGTPEDQSAVVKLVLPHTLAARTGRVEQGMVLIAVNGSTTLDKSFDETMAHLRDVGRRRPLMLTFRDPCAVPEAEAAIHQGAVHMVFGPPEGEMVRDAPMPRLGIELHRNEGEDQGAAVKRIVDGEAKDRGFPANEQQLAAINGRSVCKYNFTSVMRALKVAAAKRPIALTFHDPELAGVAQLGCVLVVIDEAGQVGLELGRTPSGQGALVKSILPRSIGSRACAGRVKPGYYVTEINGEEITGCTFEESMAFLRQSAAMRPLVMLFRSEEDWQIQQIARGTS